MSEVFEGCVVPSPDGKAPSIPEHFVAELDLVTASIGPDALIIFRSDLRDVSAFTPRIDEVAAALSCDVDRALVVRYDSRIGHRSSSLYRDGRLVGEYGQDGELFVPLDDDGEPILSAAPVLRKDFHADLEYETIRNAIQQGLETIGVGTWDELFRVMTS